MMGGELPL